jgi:hypothetical protein
MDNTGKLLKAKYFVAARVFVCSGENVKPRIIR